MRVKTDRNDAPRHSPAGPARLVQGGACQGTFSTGDTIENSMRVALRNFGLKIGQVSRRNWAARAQELAVGVPALEIVVSTFGLSGTSCAGTPPMKASARTCEPIQSGRVCVQLASA
jgi:hypothetical protein